MMKRTQIVAVFALLVFGALVGAGLMARLSAAQGESGQDARPVAGYAFWGDASDDAKEGYLAGYLDAEQYYRLIIDRALAPLSTDDGKKAIADFEQKYPSPSNITIDEVKHGIDLLYTDSSNRGMGLFLATNIVRLRLAGRPVSEVQDAIQKARGAQPAN
jgi:hypothetical protein